MATTDDTTNQDHHDLDDDDDQQHTAQKIVPNPSEPIPLPYHPLNTTAKPANASDHDLQNLIRNDVKKYIHTTIPQDHSGFVRCHIKREREGLKKGFSSIFTLYADGENENDKNFLLIARKHITIGGHAEYFIGTDADTGKQLDDHNAIAKLRGVNITASEYILYDYQHSPANEPNKQQSVAILYDQHIFGAKEPRKLAVVLADTEKNVRLFKDGQTIIDEYRAGHVTDFIELKNKAPAFNEESKTYYLKFHDDRIKQASHKNFQLIRFIENQQEYPVLQFGRIDDHNFALDYRHPLNAVQAFAIALSAFHNRFRP